MKVKTYLSIWLYFGLCCNISIAQDSIVVLSRLTNTHVLQQDSIVIVSNFGHLPGGIYQQDSLIISFEPFNFLILGSVTTSLRDLPVIEGVNVYPNPVNDVAILERATVNEVFRILLYTNEGRLIRESTWNDHQQMVIPFLKESPGTYILVIINDDQTQASTFRIIKH